MIFRINILAMCISLLLFVDTAVAVEPMYTVKEGDTLWGIAQTNGLNYAQLCKSNGKPEGWNSIKPGEKIIVGELLNEFGDVSLFAGKTESDVAYNVKNRKKGDWGSRRSLFMRRSAQSGTNEWSVIMTADGDWKPADGMTEWGNLHVGDARSDFYVVSASMSKDGRSIWMVFNPSIGTYNIVCSLDLTTKKLRVLTDGFAVEEQQDGTLFVKGKKTYLSDENGEPLGAAWYDLWMTPEGKVLRKTRPISKAEMQKEEAEGRGEVK